MVDIAPELINKIQKSFSKYCKSGSIQALEKKLKNNVATDSDAFRYAREVGNALEKAIKLNVNSDVLPDGRMYYNIAERVINDSFGTCYSMVSDYCTKQWSIKNKNAKVSLKAQVAKIDQENIDSIIDRISAAPVYDNVASVLEATAATFCKHVYDRAQETNAQFQNRVGLVVYITRESDGNCCPWCDSKAGEYKYSEKPSDIWARHDRCNCSISTESRK